MMTQLGFIEIILNKLSSKNGVLASNPCDEMLLSDRKTSKKWIFASSLHSLSKAIQSGAA